MALAVCNPGFQEHYRLERERQRLTPEHCLVYDGQCVLQTARVKLLKLCGSCLITGCCVGVMASKFRTYRTLKAVSTGILGLGALSGAVDHWMFEKERRLRQIGQDVENVLEFHLIRLAYLTEGEYGAIRKESIDQVESQMREFQRVMHGGRVGLMRICDMINRSAGQEKAKVY